MTVLSRETGRPTRTLGEDSSTDKPSNILLVGGGCGIASLWGSAHSLYLNKNHIIVLLGFKSSLKVFGEEFFKPDTDKVSNT